MNGRRACLACAIGLLTLTPLASSITWAAPPVKDASPTQLPAYDPKTDPNEQKPLNLDAPGLGSANEPTSATPPPAVGLGQFLLSVVLWLVICTGLIYGLVAVLKLFYRRFPGTAQSPLVETLGSVAVAPGLALHLVKLQDTVLILGATAGSVTLLEKVTDPDRVALLVQGFSPRNLKPNPRSFGQVLARVQQQQGFPRVSPHEPVEEAVLAQEFYSEGIAEEPRVWVVGDEEPESGRKIDRLRRAIKDLQGNAE